MTVLGYPLGERVILCERDTGQSVIVLKALLQLQFNHYKQVLFPNVNLFSLGLTAAKAGEG